MLYPILHWSVTLNGIVVIFKGCFILQCGIKPVEAKINISLGTIFRKHFMFFPGNKKYLNTLDTDIKIINNYKHFILNMIKHVKTSFTENSKNFIRLEKPVLDLKITISRNIHSVAGLPGGEAVVVDQIKLLTKNWQIVRLNKEGSSMKNLYECTGCTKIERLLLFGKKLYVLHVNGTLLQFSVDDNMLLDTHQIADVGHICNIGSLAADPASITDTDLLLMADSHKQQVITYRWSNKEKLVKVTGLSKPVSVSYFTNEDSLFYVVCDSGIDHIYIYDSTWNMVRAFGGKGSRDGHFKTLLGAVVSVDGTLIICDSGHDLISEFSIEGQFKQHIRTSYNHILWPTAISPLFPHLWVIHAGGGLRRYKIYQDSKDFTNHKEIS